MKKIYFLTILSLSFYFLNAQDIIYTITGKINQQTTSIDSILVENISNNTRILFGDLPVLPDYNINLTQQSFWGATGIGTFKKDKGFFIKSNYPGMMVLACDNNRPLLTGISIYNTNGQKIYDFQKREISAGSSINIHLGRVGLYVVKIMTPFGVQTFKAIGSSQQKNDNLFVNITGQSGFVHGLKSSTAVSDDGFSFSTGDSIRISIYKQKYYAYPAVLKITGSKSISFIFNKSSGIFTDPRDGQTYNIITIGSQTWMAENLNYETSNSWWYDNSSANGDIYGRLYYWDAAIKACPSGWHLPSDDEWKTLEIALGMSQSEADNSFWRGTDEGGKMKEAGTTHWDSPNTGATNSSGFTALPGGFRDSLGSFASLGDYGWWWSSSDGSGKYAWNRRLYYNYDQVDRYYYNEKASGFSVRCLKGSGNTPPTALFTVSPSSGTTSTNFAFDASGSTDNEDPTSNLQVRWDFDGNGTWDTGWDTNKTTNHQYSSKGTYTAKLEVKDTKGLTGQYTKSITVSNASGTGTFTDPRDGQTYQTVKIGSQTWMAENLNYDTTNSWWYDNDSANGDIYGRLYTWDAALNACPSGWHLPSNHEWTILSDFLGGANIAGGKMKETGTAHWNSPNTGATNSSGFTALPGGYRDSSGSFYGLGYNGGLWSSTESGSNAGARSPNYNNAQVGRGYSYKTNGHSVRCLKGSGNTPPTALFTVSPSSGTTSTNFAFDASGSTDNEDPTSNLQVRWDFDGNGTWDTGWDTNKTTNHQYSSEGTYTTKLEVKDTKGLTGQYTKSITVSNASGTGTFTDPRDGQTYNIVNIGNQTWMAENLNYDTTNSWWYDNDSANGDIYGRLYTWDAALNACPSGWHLPSDDEWKTLEMALGMSQSEADNSFWRGTDEGEKMKSTSGWDNNGNGTNSSGFTALPGGSRDSLGSFHNLGSNGSWWSSSEYSGRYAWYRRLYYSYDRVRRYSFNKTYSISVRCLKGSDNTPPTALFTVSPSLGTKSTNFAFDASGSTDNEDPTSNLQVRWDFDGNGTWDTGWDTNKTTNHQYSSEGTYTTKLEVKDTKGLTGQYTKSITVSNASGTGTFTDPRDGQTYKTVKIGSQTWMAENLNYDTTNSWWHDNDSANGDIYGRLYTWDAALNACPSGWHLPTDDEWTILSDFLGGADIAGGKMKEAGTTHWNSPNTGATNSSGFTALPGGDRYSKGWFFYFGLYGCWWSSTDYSGTFAWRRYLYYRNAQVDRGQYYKTSGFSVRCLKN